MTGATMRCQDEYYWKSGSGFRPRLPSFRASGTTSISALSGTRTQWQNDVARVTVLPPYAPLLMYA